MNKFYFYQAEISNREPSYLVCYCSGSEFDLISFYNEIKFQFRSCIFTRNLLIISPSFNKEKINTKLINTPALNKLKDQINSYQNLNVHTCFIDKNGNLDIAISKNSEKDQARELSTSQINKIFECGVFHILKTRNLIIEASPNFHFVKPSGKHTSKFISVSNILERSAEASFLATLILKFLPNKIERIYVDTSGIYTLAYEIANLNKLFNDSNEIVSIDSFGSYGGLDDYQFSSDQNTLVLISASTSSDLYKNLKNNPSLEQASIVSVVMLQSNTTEQNVLINFDHYQKNHCKNYFKHFDSYKENECPMCLKEYSIPVTLEKSKFSFEAPRTETCLPLAVDSDSNLRGIIKKYKDLEVFKCLFDGVDGTTNPTPEYFIDVSKLVLNSVDFKKLVEIAVLRHFPINADCILHCKDKGAKELAELIRSKVNTLGKDISLVEGEFNDEVKPTSGIVVVAGSIQSGKSLLNISRYLRQYRDLPITYIVGFAKYNSEAEFSKLQKDLTFSDGPCGNHKFHSIENILLPIYENKKDSWRREEELLKELEPKYGENLTLKDLIKKRMLFLKKASSPEMQGIGDQIFLESSTGSTMSLGPTFAFWSKPDNSDSFYHQATVYFTISSVLQKLRTVPKKDGIAPLGDGYIIRQLDPLMFDRFNEGIIQASILRASKSRELNYSADDNKSRIVGSLIERMLKHPDLKDSEALPEFLLALCTKKLQIKKDHLLGLQKHDIDVNEKPYIWMLADHARDVLFEEPQPSATPF